MLLGNKIHSDKKIAIAVMALGGLLILSIFSNAILGVLAIKLYKEQKIVTVPMGIRQPLVTSIVSADEYFLKMTALSFLSLRLNVTPETVDACHKELLMYVNPQHRPEIERVIAADAEIIKTSNLTTAFYMNSYTVSPTDGAFIVTGVLRSSTGDRPLDPVSKTYRLLMKYSNGTTEIESFTEIKE